MTNHRLLALGLAWSLCTLAATGCDDDDDDLIITAASLEVINDSDFTIIDIRLFPVGSSSIGDNLLRGDFLSPGESLLLGVSCDFYDAQLIDEAGVDCRLYDLDLCLNDASWIIQNNTCDVFGAAR